MGTKNETEKLTSGQKRAKELLYNKTNVYQKSSVAEKEKIFDFAKGYMQFLNECKTEREACEYIVNLAKKFGFQEFHFGDKLEVGGKYFFVNRNKCVAIFKIGKNNLQQNGMKILGAHIDSPRLDLKPSPVFEDSGFCFLKTHYYGGIKKYQWATIPLALHGTAVLANGETVNVKIGDEQNEPVFYISDLLPHLAQEQMSKSGREIITAEQLNIVAGGIPFGSTDEDKNLKDAVKLNFLSLLNEKYGIKEEDFFSSEICAVPATKAKEIGLDRAFIGAYGHDDKSCAYPVLQAVLNSSCKDTVMALFVDKEEIGSDGSTGMKSKVFEDLFDYVCECTGADERIVRANSKCLSADVTSCFNPNFPNVFERQNAAIISNGVVIEKCTGSSGKGGANDASAEFVGQIRKMMAENNVIYQTGEIGKVDIGGGGTIAKYIAQLNIDTIDIGVPVVSMHSPFEMISKADLYSAYTAFSAFVK